MHRTFAVGLLLGLATVATAQVAPPPAPQGSPNCDPCAQPCPPCDPCPPCQPCVPGQPCPPGTCPPGCDPCACERPPRPHPILNRLRADPCTKQREFWFGGEYLLWHVRNGPVGPVAAVTPPGAAIGAVLADPGGLTTPVGGNVGYGPISGGRLSGGVWWGRDCDTVRGFEMSAFLLERKNGGYVLTAPAGGGLVRPFTDLRTLTPSLAVVAFPGVAAGTLAVDSSTRLWGTEDNLVLRIDEGRGLYYDLLLGARYLQLDENLTLSQSSTLLGTGTAGFLGQTLRAPATLGITDTFQTTNRFAGGQLGNRFGVRRGDFFVEMYGKVAVGWVRESVDTGGNTVVTGAGPQRLAPGGLLVVPGTAGHRSVDDFAVVPEFGATAGCYLTNWLKLTAGYSALYWSRVARPGDQLTTAVNPNLVPASTTFGTPGGVIPTAGGVNRSSLWVNGVSFGAVVSY